MFRLLAILFLFVIFVMQLMLGYGPTISSFNQAQELNVYKFITKNFHERYKESNDNFGSIYIKGGSKVFDMNGDEADDGIEDILYLYLKTGLHVRNEAGPQMSIIIPVIIKNENNIGDSDLYTQMDNKFEKIKFPSTGDDKIMLPGNNQYISSGNNYYKFGDMFGKSGREELRLHLGYLYTYCFLDSENYNKYQNNNYDFSTGECSIDKATGQIGDNTHLSGSVKKGNIEKGVFYLR